MTHNLDEINAALALGDCPLIPKGSICCCRGALRIEWAAVVIGHLGDMIKARPVLARRETERVFFVKISNVSQVISIPPGSPPFSEWERP